VLGLLTPAAGWLVNTRVDTAGTEVPTGQRTKKKTCSAAKRQTNFEYPNLDMSDLARINIRYE